MDWYEIAVKTNEEDVDKVSSILLGQGCGGVYVDDPGEIKNRLENPLPSDYVGEDLIENIPDKYFVRGYFSKTCDIENILQNIKNEILNTCKKTNRDNVIVSVVNDNNWNSYKKYLKPFNILKNIKIVPSRSDYTPSKNEKVIYIDPGMAFGTGVHETTKLCAFLVEKYANEDFNLADIGTGTGILSIIAHLKGISDITAVDIDDAAVKAAKDNLLKNKINNVQVKKGSIDVIKNRKYSMVVSNILAKILINMAENIKNVLKPPGYVILSGIIKSKQQEVKATYENIGFEIVETKYENDWVAMIFKCVDFM